MVIVGEVAKTATPVPVSSVSEAASAAEAAVVVAFDEASVKRARDAVRDEKVTAPERVGVAMVGEVPKTATPVPVSSVRAVRRLAEVKEPSDAALPTDVTIPVKLALVVTLPAVKEAPVPVKLVPTRVDGVPKFGVVKTGLVVYATTPVPDSSERMVASFADVLIEEVARKPRVEVADQVGTPPTTERMLPVLPIVRFPNVFAAVA